MKERHRKLEAGSRKAENIINKTGGEAQMSGIGQRTKKGLLFFLSLVFCFLSFGPGLLSAAYGDEVGARAAVVIDGTTEKILFGKNPNWKLPPASTTKLITAMVVLDNISPDHVITVSEAAANTPSISPRLRAGERFTVRNMLYLALMRSVNSAAVVLAEAVTGSEEKFVQLMNERAARLGAENTRFINASGLPGPGQYITAFDLAKVMKESLQYPLIREVINTRVKDIYSTDGRRILVKNTDELLWEDSDLLGGKTGFTRAARHCFVCAARKGDNILITSILGEPVRGNLWRDSQMLLARGYEVQTQKTEPVIYFSSAKESPVVLASYEGARTHKRHSIARHRATSSERLYAQKNKTRAAHKKRRGGRMNIAKKGKKSSGKSLT
ncbi:MAG: D-alanyl-D-alanine carboxypeptidase [Nitrospirae bacterium]|nr:D-alanyl-D-alanine carboxypeptidase [Nitrospirota bacterium]